MSDSNRNIEYRCTKCGGEYEREDLMVVRTQFLTMGRGAKIIKSRVSDWVCATCASYHPHWDMPKFDDSPGFKDVNAAKTGSAGRRKETTFRTTASFTSLALLGRTDPDDPQGRVAHGAGEDL